MRNYKLQKTGENTAAPFTYAMDWVDLRSWPELPVRDRGISVITRASAEESLNCE